MISRTKVGAVVCALALGGTATAAHADAVQFPGTRPLGMGGAMRAAATGDAGPLLNPSGISLIRTYQVEGAYQYGKAGSAHDVHVAAVDSTSAFNLGGAIYYTYHRDTPGGAQTQTGHLGGISLSFPFAEKIFLGGNAKYIRFTDAAGGSHSGFTFDAGLTLRPLPELSLAAVGYNLVDKKTAWAPRAFGGGAALLPIPTLLFAFDTVMETVYGDPGRDHILHFMGGAELSFASSAAIRAGGGRDGITKNGYFSLGVSALSADIGSVDIGFRQDVSGTSKSTVFGFSARLFVPTV
jgi:hypothetical protein